MTVLCLTIDFINDICHPDGKIAAAAANIEAGNVLEHCNRVLTWARTQGNPVAHIKVGFDRDYLFCSGTSPIFRAAREKGALVLGSWGTEFCDGLEVRGSEPVIIKHRISGFYGTELMPLVSALGAREVLLMGVSSENAVELTAREAHDRDLAVTVVRDACSSPSLAQHEATMTFLSRIARVVASSELTG
ncbi:cysteine hydrolase family protein [Roseibium sp. RKSG952]|uniref:cysteine hydrolase family protein n=1 Tax=Roseibium sp. RKSG952 TaxID=2529384 RepID=UPI0012BD6527|nr:isochorismatase family cysteine hydrolase [Roseibium sp. RKSG952]MTH96861.1 cysteine hydrolase [Roseibium sp. RKSG952]